MGKLDDETDRIIGVGDLQITDLNVVPVYFEISFVEASEAFARQSV